MLCLTIGTAYLVGYSDIKYTIKRWMVLKCYFNEKQSSTLDWYVEFRFSKRLTLYLIKVNDLLFGKLMPSFCNSDITVQKFLKKKQKAA